MTPDRDPCQSYTFPEALCCGDCSTINRVYLADNLPHVRSDRDFFTVEDIDNWNEHEGVTP